jgi:hypothetical protein
MCRTNNGEYFGNTSLRRTAGLVSHPPVVMNQDILAVLVRAQHIGQEVCDFDN